MDEIIRMVPPIMDHQPMSLVTINQARQDRASIIDHRASR
jgi:hypothetical protein